MTFNTRHHPSKEQIRGFAGALLSQGMSVAIAAHLEYCEQCRDLTRTEERQHAEQWANNSHESSPRSPGRFNVNLDRITSQQQESSDASPGVSSGTVPIQLHMLERSITLPRILAKIARKGVIWKKYTGGINQANLDIDSSAQCAFLYMKPGSQAPSHKHRGFEITLVLDGSFSDELGSYVPGDFIFRRGNETHTPKTLEGCLCFTWLDGPLTFTSGLSRLLNPINRFLFYRGIRQAN